MANKFTNENFETEVLQAGMPVLVDFYAEWCGPCKMMGPIVDKIADEFEALREGGVHYRLYAPPCTDPRPLILFLHGGGHSGYDNWRQVVTTYVAAALAERDPDR